MLLSEAWYASGIFWSIVAVAVALVAIPAGVVAAYRSANPKRRVVYGMFNRAPLVGAPADVRGDLQIRHGGELVSDPQLVTLALASRSRRDISSDDFDRQRPIVFDLGVPIVKLIDHSSTVGKIRGAPAPDAVLDGTQLRLSPGLIRRRHLLTWTLLVDGKPELNSEILLKNVDDRRRDGDSATLIISASLPSILNPPPRWVYLIWILPVGFLIAVILTFIFSGPPPAGEICL